MRALSAEGVLSLRPTLVIATTAAGPATTLDQLKSDRHRGVVLPDHYDYESVVTKIEAVGRLTGKAAEAQAMIAQGRADMAALTARLAGEPAATARPVPAVDGRRRPQAAGANTAADGIIRLAGGANAVEGWPAIAPLTPEAVIASRADFVLVTRQTVEAMGGIDKILAQPALSATPAGRAAASCSSTRSCCWASARARRRPRRSSPPRSILNWPAPSDGPCAGRSRCSRSPPSCARSRPCASAPSRSASASCSRPRAVVGAARCDDGGGALRHPRAARAGRLRGRRRARGRRRGDAEPVPQSARRSRPARRVERRGTGRRVGDRAGREGDAPRAAGRAALAACRSRHSSAGLPPRWSSIASPTAAAWRWSARCCLRVSPSMR